MAKVEQHFESTFNISVHPAEKNLPFRTRHLRKLAVVSSSQFRNPPLSVGAKVIFYITTCCTALLFEFHWFEGLKVICVKSSPSFYCHLFEVRNKHFSRARIKMQNQQRAAPNILVTGTPGVGKSTLCAKLGEVTGLSWLEVSKIAKENGCIEQFDEEYQCGVLDEDKLLDGLEGMMAAGGNIVDYHSCNLFPERWFDAIFVLRTDNTTLFDRLSSRGYNGKKLDDNIQCEIFQTILEEALNSYKTEIVHELSNVTPEQLGDNVKQICLWIQQWFAVNSS